jgi:hypothetical protein
MASLDHKKHLYLDICHDFVVTRFGCDPGLNRIPGRNVITATLVTPEDGGTFRQFNESNLSWNDSGCRFTNWSIVHDGRVFVSYPDGDLDDAGMVFRVGHPREASELLHLLVQPMDCLGAAASDSLPVKLGELVDAHVLIPAGDGWRALDLGHPPPGLPHDFRMALGFNLVQDWNAMIRGATCEAGTFADRWPAVVGALPNASPLLRAGYVVRSGMNLCHAIDLLVDGPQTTAPFLNMLLVPLSENTSSFYLREYLNGDCEAATHLQATFAAENDLDKLHADLGNVVIRMPAALTEQVRLAAPVNLMRQRILQAAERLADTQASFGQLTIQSRDAVLAIEGWTATQQATIKQP